MATGEEPVVTREFGRPNYDVGVTDVAGVYAESSFSLYHVFFDMTDVPEISFRIRNLLYTCKYRVNAFAMSIQNRITAKVTCMSKNPVLYLLLCLSLALVLVESCGPLGLPSTSIPAIVIFSAMQLLFGTILGVELAVSRKLTTIGQFKPVAPSVEATSAPHLGSGVLQNESDLIAPSSAFSAPNVISLREWATQHNASAASRSKSYVRSAFEADNAAYAWAPEPEDDL